MGLFVWNDRRWQFIENNEPYDKKNFCIVKTLFVRWLKSSDTKVINGAILKAFEKFGDIAAVENVNSSAAKDKSDVHEAYVTFSESISAYKAFKTHRFGESKTDEVITVLPADTWRMFCVPSKEIELNELTRRIVNIDEDEDPQYIYRFFITPGMLLRVFEAYLRVSKPFLEGVDLHYALEDWESSETESDVQDEIPTSNDENTESEMPNGSEMDLKLQNELNCLKNCEFEKRIAEVLAHNLGPKFESLRISKEIISMEMLQWLKPVLKQIRKLTIHTDADCNILYALPGLCPNVYSLHLDGEEWQGEFEHVRVEKWASLRELFLNVAVSDNEDGRRKFHMFLATNTQLTALQIETVMDLNTLSAIGKMSRRLTSLAFVRESFEGLNSVLQYLGGLSLLRSLKISALEVDKKSLGGLIKCAKRLSKLPNLQLITIFFNCQPNAKDESFEHLSEFCITHHYNCKCHGPYRVLSFGEHDVQVPDDTTILVLIANTKPPLESADQTLEADIQSAFKKTTKFFPNIISMIEISEPNHFVYVQISSIR